jgi:ABC-type glycerol-3-phosphate transport system permease component
VAAVTSWTQSRALQRRLRVIISYSLLVLGFIWFMYPLAWMVLGSLKTVADFFQLPPRFFPSSLHVRNYPDAWTIVPFGRYFLNTIAITLINVVGIYFSCSIVAYSFARLRFPGRTVLFAVMLSTIMLPGWVTVIPTYIIFQKLGWIDSWYPLTVPAFFGSAVYIFLMRQFFLTIPKELDEAAELDGCGKVGIYWHIVMPLSKPVLITVVLFVFISTWNSFFGPLIYIHTPDLFPVSIGLAFMRAAMTAMAGQPVQGLLLAASVFTSIPPIVAFLLGQNYFVRGITLTGRSGM